MGEGGRGAVIVRVSLLFSRCSRSAPGRLREHFCGRWTSPSIRLIPARGKLLISYKTDVSGVDPATCYDQQCFEAVPLVFQGLYDYNRGWKIIPNIAAGMPRSVPMGAHTRSSSAPT